MLKLLRSKARDVAGMLVKKENVLCRMRKPHQRKQVFNFRNYILIDRSYQRCDKYLGLHFPNAF